ncbi:MAG TPA: hypothetical protein PLU22_21130 [Polyangiaceae bacterium]|nr:hypothetical protein [Polyangiaceae bacterium]
MAGRLPRMVLLAVALALPGCPFAVTDRYSREPEEPASRCADGELDGEETDVDCGGPDCEPCEAGGACLGDDDCASGSCDGDTCVSG